MYKYFLKRLFDIVFSAIALILLSPVFLFTALIIKIKLGSPIIFKQERPGKNGKIFKMSKFRTMTNEKDDNGKLLPDYKRLTKFGRFLRAASLDELPEIWDIFRGKMSIIGPRPLAVSYLEYYNEREKKRHEVRPGLTGLAQIRGRTSLDWEKRFELDIMYVEKLSFILDVKIFFQTIKKVFKREDIKERDETNLLSFNDYRKLQRKQRSGVGSDFWEMPAPLPLQKNSFERFENCKFVFSGRTAIDLIAKELLKKDVKTILLPDYCCESVSIPFFSNGISCEYYQIKREESKFNWEIKEIEAEAILICDYFAFDKNFYNSLKEKAQQKGFYIIHDITHSFFCDELNIDEDDYYFASLRKWLAVTDGAVLGSKHNCFEITTGSPNNEFLNKKQEAMILKAGYINGESIEKSRFLALYKEAEALLASDYQNKGISIKAKQFIENTDFDLIKKKRTENYNYLIENLNRNLSALSINAYPPYALPVFCKDEVIRNALREYLISIDIYLPIHWPDSKSDSVAKDELTIVIDQRYDKNDMQKIIEAINDFFGKLKAC